MKSQICLIEVVRPYWVPAHSPFYYLSTHVSYTQYMTKHVKFAGTAINSKIHPFQISNLNTSRMKDITLKKNLEINNHKNLKSNNIRTRN